MLSIIDRAIAVLHEDSADRLDDLKKAPWHVLLAVKWACQDRMNQISTGKSISAYQFDELRQQLWDLPSRFASGITEFRSAQLFFRQLIRPQIDFQRRESFGFVREAALLALQQPNSKLRTLFSGKTGLKVEDFIDLSISISAAVIGRKAINALWLSPLRSAYGEKIDDFIGLISCSAEDLVGFFRGMPDANQKVASELFEFPVVYRYPFLRVGRNLICWNRSVFFRGMENMVHAIMSESGQDYLRDFTRLFERHVISQSELLPYSFFGEDILQKWIPAGWKAPDGLLSFDGINVFVESKAGMFDESVKVAGNSEIFRSKTKMLQKAIEQARSASVGIRVCDSAPEEVRSAVCDYLIVVTNKDVGVGQGRRLASMCGCELEGDGSENLPLEHVYFMPIEDYERMISGVVSDKKSLSDFLRSCVARDAAAETSVFLFSQHLDADTFPYETSELVKRALSNANERLASALGENPVVVDS